MTIASIVLAYVTGFLMSLLAFIFNLKEDQKSEFSNQRSLVGRLGVEQQVPDNSKKEM